MASCNDDFPLITEDVNPHTNFNSHITIAGAGTSPKKVAVAVTGESDADSANAEYFSQIQQFDDSDPNKPTTRAPTSNKRNPYYYKKLKPGNNNENGVGSASGGGGEYRVDYRKDREEWSDTAIACLLEAYTEKFAELNRGNLRGRDWEDVAEMVNERCQNTVALRKSVEQCKNKIDNLKKRYKVELQRMSNGGLTTSHWHWFKKIETIVGNSPTFNKGGSEEDNNKSGGGGSTYTSRQSKRYT